MYLALKHTPCHVNGVPYFTQYQCLPTKDSFPFYSMTVMDMTSLQFQYQYAMLPINFLQYYILISPKNKTNVQ